MVRGPGSEVRDPQDTRASGVGWAIGCSTDATVEVSDHLSSSADATSHPVLGPRPAGLGSDRAPGASAPPPQHGVALGRFPGWRIEWRRTRRSLLGIRYDRVGDRVVRLHPDVQMEPDWSVSIERWLKRPNGRDERAALTALLDACRARQAERNAATDGAWASELVNVGEGVAAPGRLEDLLSEVHRRWFGDLPLPPASWGRRPPRRRLRHLRFGCYRRREGRIEISPRLARPWVPLVFLAHVLYHELCHHRQSCQPGRGRETAHSPRFRAWERGFPGHADALRWERLALPWLLDDTPPPWYRSAGSNACVLPPS